MSESLSSRASANCSTVGALAGANPKTFSLFTADDCWVFVLDLVFLGDDCFSGLLCSYPLSPAKLADFMGLTGLEVFSVSDLLYSSKCF